MMIDYCITIESKVKDTCNKIRAISLTRFNGIHYNFIGLLPIT